MGRYNLRDGVDPQVYGLGVKELWQVPKEKHQPGLVIHSQGWPLPNDVGGGSFLYHFGDGLISVGFVTHLSYSNPHLSPFEEMQRFKTHPGDPRLLRGRQAHRLRCARDQRRRPAVDPEARVPGRRADRLQRRLREPAAHQGFAQRDEDRHARGRSGVRRAAGGTRARRTRASIRRRSATRGRSSDLHKVRNVKPGLKWGMWPGTVHGGLHMWLNDLGLGGARRLDAAAQADRPRGAAAGERGAAHRVSEAGWRADVRPPVVGVPVGHGARGRPAGAPAAAQSRRSRSR